MKEISGQGRRGRQVGGCQLLRCRTRRITNVLINPEGDASRGWVQPLPDNATYVFLARSIDAYRNDVPGKCLSSTIFS